MKTELSYTELSLVLTKWPYVKMTHAVDYYQRKGPQGEKRKISIMSKFNDDMILH